MPSIEERLADLRGAARRRSPSVRVLAAYSGHTDCNLATTAFVAGVDLDTLLKGTKYEAPFGQSPFAFARGLSFEKLVAQDDYAATRQLLQESIGFPEHGARVANLRKGFPKGAEGMQQRATRTRELVRAIIRGERSAAHLIDGAVLQTLVAGVPANFEADALAARGDGLVHVGEVKSFPVVDERADPDKLASALDQVAVYISLLRDVIEELGGDSSLVSTDALLITPKNVGLTPTLSIKNVTKRIARFGRLMALVPSAAEVVASLPGTVTFSPVADEKGPEEFRLDVLHQIADRVGTSYSPRCLSTCGNAFFCRERAFQAGAPCLIGGAMVRALPHIRSLGRAAELTRGAMCSDEEAGAAAQLARAGRLYDQVLKTSGTA